MDQQPIRWGILATGAIAATVVADLRRLPDAAVLAVGSRSQPAAAGFAQRYGIPRAYGDWQSLAADPDLDVIYIATPHSAHHAAAKLCLTAGRPVLCEKPLTLDADSARDLVDTARAAGVFLMEAMWTRCNPVIRRVVGWLADEAIGEVTAVHADFGIAPPPPGHRLLDPALGGGALLDLGIYPVTIAHLALGAPQTVTAWASLTEQGVDAQTGIVLGYPSGAMAVLSCGIRGDTGVTATITGTRGRIDLPPGFFRPEQAVLHRPGAVPEIFTARLTGHGYLPQAAEVHRCLRGGLSESELVPHATTIEVMSILDAVRERIGLRYQPVPIPAPRPMTA